MIYQIYLSFNTCTTPFYPRPVRRAPRGTLVLSTRYKNLQRQHNDRNALKVQTCNANLRGSQRAVAGNRVKHASAILEWHQIHIGDERDG